MKTNKITITEEESKICKIDGKKFSSSKFMIWHVQKEYGLKFEDYIIKCYYNGVRPICLKTGSRLTFKAHKLGPWFSDCAKNCFPRKPHSDETKKKIKEGCEKKSMELYGVKNPFQSDVVKEKIRKTNIIKYGFENPANNEDIKLKALDSYYETIKNNFENGDYNKEYKRSSFEIDFENKLKSSNIEFSSPFLLNGKKFDFYIKTLDLVVEIDGEAFHKNTLEDLSLINISSSINDYEKNILINEKKMKLARIRWNKDENFTNINELKNVIDSLEYKPDYQLKFRQIICKKDYFKNYIRTHGKDKLKSYVYLFVKFLKTFQNEFPQIESNCSRDDVIESFKKFDHKSVVCSDKFLLQRCPKTSNYFLKSLFKSYWESSYKGNKSPIEEWKNVDLLKKIIEYRIGCNDSNEIFDFSLIEIIRGMSARRLTVSFFNPFLAFSIYRELIGINESPIVIDPCCGFGGRILGFKMAYPNGTYIGCEPNKKTFNELNKLIELFEFKNVVIHNKKYEDFDLSDINYDLIFTSIPYYDTEIYGENKNIQFKEWNNTFIKSIVKNKKTYINCSIGISNLLGWSDKIWKVIESTTSHYDTKNSTKVEGIYKF